VGKELNLLGEQPIGEHMTKLEQIKANRLAKQQAEIKLLEENDAYCNYILDVEDESTAVARLEAIITRVNGIEAITTNDGNKYVVNCYSLPSYIFGETMARVLGLVNTSSSMFTAERQREFSAITGVDYLTWANVNNFLGSPAYYSKGKLVAAVEPQYSMLEVAIKDLAIKLDLPLSFTSSVNLSNLERYFTNQENKATEKLVEFNKSQAEFGDSQFTIED